MRGVAGPARLRNRLQQYLLVFWTLNTRRQAAMKKLIVIAAFAAATTAQAQQLSPSPTLAR